jgi:DNA-binding LacI/PurR family transcriptional regulator
VPDAMSVIGRNTSLPAVLHTPPLTTVGNEAPDMLERLIASVLSVCHGDPVLPIARSRHR